MDDHNNFNIKFQPHHWCNS